MDLKSVQNKVIAISIVAVVAAASASVYFCVQFKKSSSKISAQQEAAAIINRLSGHMFLPDGEKPTVATVTDLEKLKDQPFFANAKIGDKVIIYTESRKAVLYRPSDDKIVEVAPLNISGNP